MEEELAFKMMEFGFELSGSRMMAQRSSMIIIGPDTDWDFVAPNEEKFLDFLVENGFKDKCVNPAYCDMISMNIFEHPDANVECVIKRNMDVYHTVFNAMTTDFYYNYIWKSSPDLRVSGRNEIREIINQLVFVAEGTDFSAQSAEDDLPF